MPPIDVTTFIRHNTDTTLGKGRNEDEWAAIHMKKIIKGDPLNQYAKFSFPIAGVQRTIVPATKGQFETEICSRFAEKIVADHGRDVLLVPVPNGDGVVGQANVFRTLALANSIAAAMGPPAAAADLLRWSVQVGKAHLGERGRDVDGHIAKLAINGNAKNRIVLFDDVVTTGSQLCAAKLKLEEAGYNVVGAYAMLDVLDEGERGTAPAWKTVTRNLVRIRDLFEDLGLY